MVNDLLSAQEIADIMKITRNTVYEIIKRGELKYTKVGKQVRVARQDLEEFLGGARLTGLARSVTTQPPAHLNAAYTPAVAPSPIHMPAPVVYTGQPAAEERSRGNEFVICGQDISLDILTNYLATVNEVVQVYRSSLGSYNGIYALYLGRVQIATAHLWDGDIDEYNVTYVKKMMPGIPALVMRICRQQHGFYVPAGNPKRITGWQDLRRKDITIINREKGSGTRVLLDERLRLMGVLGEYVAGYGNECKSHPAAAMQVARGTADISIGSETGCKSVTGVEFIPLQTECYDLILRLADADRQPYRTILEIVASDAFRQDLESVGGYDTSQTGRIIWQ